MGNKFRKYPTMKMVCHAESRFPALLKCWLSRAVFGCVTVFMSIVWLPLFLAPKMFPPRGAILTPIPGRLLVQILKTRIEALQLDRNKMGL